MQQSKERRQVNLLDVYSVKRFSSYHTKPLPENIQLLFKAFFRTLFLPLYPRWWAGSSARAIKHPIGLLRYAITSAVYLCHVSLCLLYLLERLPPCSPEHTRWAVYLPVGLMIVFSACHAQILACTLGSSVSSRVGTESSSDSEEEDPREVEIPPLSDMDQPLALDRYRVNCSVWDARGARRKRALRLEDIRDCLVKRVRTTAPNTVYQQAAFVASGLIPLLPILYGIFRFWVPVDDLLANPNCIWELSWQDSLAAVQSGAAEGLRQVWENRAGCLLVPVVSGCSVLLLTVPIFQQLAAAEVTFSRRVVYARCFKALISSHKAQAMGLPHFSLKAPENIRVWLALRGGRPWLARQEHERTADVVGTLAFVATVFLLFVIHYTYLSASESRLPFTLLQWEVLIWGCFLSAYVLRFLFCGTRINAKYSAVSILMTEQINVHLRIMECPESGVARKAKLHRLHVSHNVLKLAVKLLKELGKPTRISGFAVNPMLYNVVRIVFLSACSAFFSDLLGFNLRLPVLAKMK